MNPPTENETQAQHCSRDLMNNKRKVNWENECKAIKFKGPTVEEIPWDKADTKVKNLIYLNLGREGQRIIHQRFSQSVIDPISAFELAHDFALSFTRPIITTYYRFLLFTCNRKTRNSKISTARSKPAARNVGWERRKMTS